MPIARVQLPDGRIARLDVPEGTTPEQVEEFAANIEPQPQEEPTSDSVGRQIGLGTRAVAQGAAALPLVAGDAANALVNQVIQGINKVAGTDIPQLDPASAAFKQILSEIGLPEPETEAEQSRAAIVEGAAGALIPIGAGGQIAKAGGRVAQRVGATLSEAPALQVASGAAAGGAAEEVKQEGGGVGAQTAAAILAGSSPAAVTSGIPAAVRGAARGTSNQRISSNLEAFKRAGTTPSVGQATEGRISRAIESVISKIPGGAGRMSRFATRQAEEIGQRADEVATGIAKGPSAEKAGRTIEKGIIGEGGFKERFFDKFQALNDDVLSFIPEGQQFPVNNTINRIGTLVKEIPGAPSVSAQKSGEILDDPLIRAFLDDASEANAVPYQAMKELRSVIGDRAASKDVIGTPLQGKLKLIYRGLTEDMEEAAKQAGPRAVKALRRANKFYSKGRDRLDLINKVVKKDTPEKVFKAATAGTREGATTLRAVMKSLPDEGKKDVAGAIVKRLGLATPGRQDDLGEVFSSQTFLTNFNKLSPEAQQTIFGSIGPDFSKNLRAIAKVSSNIAEGSQVFSNPSGTGQALSPQLIGGGAVVSGAAGVPSITAAILGVPLAANITARGMTNPSFVRWLAKSTRIPVEALPAHINNLAQVISNAGAEERQEYQGYLNDLKEAIQ